ncbi:MAG: amidohydrolase family protein [Acidobacteriaceae bacterium]|nr:amidohydrolase family protein [Acidobacteriaceae bacterium]
MRPYLAYIASTLRLMGRDRSVLFFSYLFPLVFYFIFAQLFDARQNPSAMAQVIAMVLIIAVLGNGFFGAGMRAVQDRETNVLRRFKVTPIGAGPIVVSALVAGLVGFLPVVILFFVLARIVYRMPLPHNFAAILIFVCVGVLAFRSLGMIIAAVVNSAQEGGILIQLLYLPMLFLSGATFPISVMSVWVQTLAQFLPATYLFQGVQSMMIAGQGLRANAMSILALLITTVVALVVGIKLFRWEKEEKISNRSKLWVLAVLAPFLIMGIYQAKTRENVVNAKIIAREAARNRSVLFQNAKIFVGNGSVIAHGSVLVRRGKIAEVFGTPPADTKSFNADVVDASGETLMPGLIDMHVHLGAPGGVYKTPAKYADPGLLKRRLAAYLYSGVTAVRSTGDFLDPSLELRKEVGSGKYLGAQLFACGPIFTTQGGHPEELLKYFPDSIRKAATTQFLREPESQAQARAQVDQLKHAGVDCIKAVLDAGYADWGLFNRLNTGIYDSVMSEARRDGLPSATHTGSSDDVKDAIEAGTDSIEHGSMVNVIADALFEEMKRKNIAYDPTLSVFEGLVDMKTGNAEVLNRPLLQRVGPMDLLDDTRSMVQSTKKRVPVEGMKSFYSRQQQNLLAACRHGVTLITGSDAGNMLVIHGPTVQHEMELWVESGVPAAVALQAATYNAAKLLRADNRIGLIQQGRDATFILLDGDPLEDITATEHIHSVVFSGEQIDRSDLFTQDKD